jgi:hypothetical protein
MRGSERLCPFLRDLLQARPSLVQVLDLDPDLLGGLRLPHGGEALGDGVELHQARLVGLQVLLEVVELALDHLHLLQVVTNLRGQGNSLLESRSNE